MSFRDVAGQASNTIENEKIMYQFALKKSKEINNKKAIKKLEIKKLNPLICNDLDPVVI